MNLPKELTTVTKTSKTLAYIVFLTLPFIGFFLGIKYQQTLDLANQQTTESVTVKQIPMPTSVEGKACGGFAGETGEFACPAGYKCQYPKPMYPDAQGKCVKI